MPPMEQPVHWTVPPPAPREPPEPPEELPPALDVALLEVQEARTVAVAASAVVAVRRRRSGIRSMSAILPEAGRRCGPARHRLDTERPRPVGRGRAGRWIRGDRLSSRTSWTAPSRCDAALPAPCGSRAPRCRPAGAT